MNGFCLLFRQSSLSTFVFRLSILSAVTYKAVTEFERMSRIVKGLCYLSSNVVLIQKAKETIRNYVDLVADADYRHPGHPGLSISTFVVVGELHSSRWYIVRVFRGSTIEK